MSSEINILKNKAIIKGLILELDISNWEDKLSSIMYQCFKKYYTYYFLARKLTVAKHVGVKIC